MPHTPPSGPRSKIAATAAHQIAEDKLDYATAKTKTQALQEMEYFLPKAGVNLEAFEHSDEDPYEHPDAEEAIQFVVLPERVGVVLETFTPHALRTAPCTAPQGTTAVPNLHPIATTPDTHSKAPA